MAATEHGLADGHQIGDGVVSVANQLYSVITLFARISIGVWHKAITINSKKWWQSYLVQYTRNQSLQDDQKNHDCQRRAQQNTTFNPQVKRTYYGLHMIQPNTPGQTPLRQ
jgi:hypothetical protein